MADAENAWACTVSGLDSSPLARILTLISLRVPSPLSTIAATSTVASASKRASRSPMFTGCVCVRKGSNGIDFLLFGPRSLRMRMWIGIWPPSKRARSLPPARDPAPLWPRPDVLPIPDPCPRPTRLRGRRLPGAGVRVCRPTA